MTKKCEVCNKFEDIMDFKCFFYEWPLNYDLRVKWLNSLGVTNIDISQKDLYLCSNHFENDDFHFQYIEGSLNIRKLLKENAVPKRFTHQFITSNQGMCGETNINDESPTDTAGSATDTAQSYTITASSSTATASETVAMTPEKQRLPLRTTNAALGFCESDDNSTDSTDTAGSTTQTAESSTVTASSSTATASESAVKSSQLRLETVQHTIAVDKPDVVYVPEGKQSSPSFSPSQKRRRLNDTDNVPPPNVTRSKRKFFVGDLSSEDFATPRKAKKNWRIVKQNVVMQRKKILSLQRSKRRLKARVNSLSGLLVHLKNKCMISDIAQETLQGTLPDSSKSIVKRLLQGPKKTKYEPTLRTFAMTLHFYSPKAYSYVRNKFNNSLPDPKTISRWYQNVNGEPGFTLEALEAIKIKVAEADAKGYKIICSLVMDEMAIRQQVQFDGKKYYGFVNCGVALNNDTIPEAKEALVLMLVSINSSWKIPIGYFLSSGLTGQEKSNIVTRSLEFLSESRIIISSLTFDGAPSNFNMAKCLGADLTDVRNLKTYFLHPTTNKKIYIWLDPSHMIKLIRNCFGEYKNLEYKGHQISWDYLKKLVDFQYSEGLTAATKMKRRHLCYGKEKMRVKLATQTISRSVAVALAYLREDIGNYDPQIKKQFDGSKETENFLMVFNDCFDILNSTSKYATYCFKRAISPSNDDSIFERLEIIEKYILDLHFSGKSILNSGRKCGFLGLLVDIQSLREMYVQYVKGESPLLKYFLTYKLSQDHLEIFFCAVRSRGGHNNNPTAKQFETAYKKLLAHIEIKDADTGNATAIDSTSILHCSSSCKKITVDEHGDDLLDSDSHIATMKQIREMDFISSPAWHLTTYSEDIVKYIAGFVVISLEKCLTCSRCIEILTSNGQISLLQRRKTFENATMSAASELAIKVCLAGEKCFRFINNTVNIFNIDMNCLISATLRHLPVTVFNYFGDHIFDMEPLSDHFMNLIKLILKKYFTVRIHHETNKKLDLNVGARVRSFLTKAILFKNQ